jgi:hypothetical protein
MKIHFVLMNTKRILFFFTTSLTIVSISNLSSCRKPFCTHHQYEFAGTDSFSPEKDSINVGDTVWFRSSLPVQMVEVNTNQSVDWSRASGVVTQINFSSLSSGNPTIGAVDSFLFIPVKGNFSSNSTLPHAAKTAAFVEENGNYNLQFGIVAQKKGIYAITAVDIKNSKKNCSDADITLILGNGDSHQHYFGTVYYPGSPWGDVIQPIVQTHSYCFKVR